MKQSSPGYKVPVKHWGHGDIRDICGQTQGNILTRSNSSTGETPLRSDIAQTVGDDLVLSVAVASQAIINNNDNAAYQLRASSAPDISLPQISTSVIWVSSVTSSESVSSRHPVLFFAQHVPWCEVIPPVCLHVYCLPFLD